MNKKIIISLIAISILGAVTLGVVAIKKIFPKEFLTDTLSKEKVTPEEIKDIFFVHSYDSENICGRPQDNGAVAKLKQLGYEDGKNIRIHYFYMDTKNTYTTSVQMKERGDLALAKIKEVDPAVIFIIDDDAFRYVALPLAKSKYPIVFSGMNVQIENYNKEIDMMESRQHPGYNVTGVLETVHYTESFLLLQKIAPNVKNVLCVSDSTATGRGFVAALKLEMAKTAEFPVEVEFREVASYEEYKKVVLEANKREDIDAILPVVFGLAPEKAGDKSVVQPEITSWMVKNSKKPDVGLTFFLVDFGLLSGAAVDFPALGGQAAVKIAKILEGEQPGNISIDEAVNVSICVNLARAEQLGLKVSQEIIAASDKVYVSMKAYPEYKMKEK